MCQAVKCGKCEKAGWRGCGAHVEQVLQGVPKADRCQCAAGTPTHSEQARRTDEVRRS